MQARVEYVKVVETCEAGIDMSSVASQAHPIHWLQHADQRLGLVPSLGGGVAAWQLTTPSDMTNWLDLWRPWNGDLDRYSLASMPLIPWSNRISSGGFEHDGRFHPLLPNRTGEPYPLHGDGWLQPWCLRQSAPNAMEMELHSDAFNGNPYTYHAQHRFVLHEEGMNQTLTVTHQGLTPMPYGLGQHPWFLRGPSTRLNAQVHGVWLSGDDLLPTRHTTELAPEHDPRHDLNVNGTLLDNTFTGWSGVASIDWPDHGLALTLQVPEFMKSQRNEGYCHVYRPCEGPTFCFEPVTHPIDAFHLPGRPGLRILHTGEQLTLHTEWRFKRYPKQLLL